MNLILIGFFVYFIIIGLIAFVSYLNNKKAGTYKEVILGNRSVNYVLTALSAHASDMSDWLFMAFPAALFVGGLLNGWIAVGLIIGMWITWQFIAPPLRIMTEKYNAMTLSTYFEKRYNDNSGIIRLLSAVLSILFFSVYIAAGLKGFGFLAETVFNLPYIFGIIVALVCVIAYIYLGGYRTLAWIDCFQALFLLIVIFIVPIIAWQYINGWDSVVYYANQKNIQLNLFAKNWKGLLNSFLIALSWSVGYFGTPHILTKFMGICDAKELSKAKYIGLSWQIAVLSAAGLSGLIGIAFFPNGLLNKELVFIQMVKELFNPLQIGFILSAVAGATLSVITAQVLVLVSVITEDLYKRSLRPQASEKELLWVYHFSIILICFLSFFVSLNKSNTIQQLVHYAWMGFGCSFGPLVLLSLHSNYINKNGAIASILIGGFISAIWYLFGTSFYAIEIPAVLPGFILSVLCAYFISWLTRKYVF